jgi:hypothetical protein
MADLVTLTSHGACFCCGALPKQSAAGAQEPE